MLELIGESKAQAKKDAATVMRIETALAKASLTRVERRDPYNLDAQDDGGGAGKTDAVVRLEALPRRRAALGT